jgi:hypothetical protein
MREGVYVTGARWQAFVKSLTTFKPDLRDICVFGGLALMSYGLWMLRPWLGVAVPGFILMILGLIGRE